MANKMNPFENDSLKEVDSLLELLIPSSDAPKQQFAGLLGEFMEARMANNGWTVEYLADKMGCEPELLSDILTGALPESEIGDDLLDELADAIGYEANVLRIMLGREVSAYRPQAEYHHDVSEADAPHGYTSRIEQLLDELTKLMLQGVDERFTAASRGVKHYKRHDFLLRQIEMIIAQQRDDVKLVQILIDELKTGDLSEFDDDKHPHGMDIRRIIQFIKETR